MLIDNSAKTNWKFIGVVAILAVLVGVGILLYSSSGPEEEVPQIASFQEDETMAWQTYANEEFGFEFQYPSDGDLGYLSVEGAYLGSLSTVEARNTNTLIVGSRKGMHIIDIFADVNNVSIHSESMEVILNGVSYEKYEVVGVSYSTVYVTTYNAKQYWIELQKSRLADQIFSTFRFIEGASMEKVACDTAKATLSEYINQFHAPQECTQDSDCEAYYVLVEPCVPPVVQSKANFAKVLEEGTTEYIELLKLQDETRAACIDEFATQPACDPILVNPVCTREGCLSQEEAAVR